MHTPATHKPGFTIIELLIAVIIIGLLTSAAVANYLTAQRNSRDQARKTTVNTLANAIETYYSVQHAFPGNIDGYTGAGSLTGTTFASGQNVSVSAYDSVYGACQYLENTNKTITDPTTGNPTTVPALTYVYSYSPLTSTQACTSAAYPKLTNVSNGVVYDPQTYAPYPTWIPGLAAYMNPMPTEKKFIGHNGSSNAFDPPGTFNVGDVLVAQDSGLDQTRTFQYRHLVGGYAVYTRLESSSTGTEAAGVPVTDDPKLPQPYQTNGITGSNVYMVRR